VKQTAQKPRTNQKRKTKRKTPPKNSTPNRFPVIPDNLNRHHRDLRRLNDPQNLPSSQPSKQARGSGIRDCSREKGVYTLLIVGQKACIRGCQGKKGVYALKQGQTRVKG
jgi:hypothetical protein